MSEIQERNEDEEMRKLLQPSPNKNNEDELISLLQKNYCKENVTLKILKKLDSYDDYNCLVSLNDEKYLCKVYNGVASDSFQKGQNKLSSIVLYNTLFDHLSNTNDINTSYAIPTQSGNYFCTTSANVTSSKHSPYDLIVQLLHWVDGIPMSSNKSLTKTDFMDAGLYLGTLCTHLDTFMSQQNESFIQHWKGNFHAWDMRYVTNVRKFIKYIDTEKKQQMVMDVIDEYEECILKSGVCDEFRYSLCHGDFNDANIIMKDGKVSGVIDFGDCCYSWRVADLAIAMAYSLLTTYSTSTNRSLSASAIFLYAFQSKYPLTKVEIQHLRILIQSRLAQSVTYGAFTYAQNPENEYILLHSKPGWNALEMFWGGGKERKEKINGLYATASSGQIDDVSDIHLLDSDVIG